MLVIKSVCVGILTGFFSTFIFYWWLGEDTAFSLAFIGGTLGFWVGLFRTRALAFLRISQSLWVASFIGFLSVVYQNYFCQSPWVGYVSTGLGLFLGGLWFFKGHLVLSPRIRHF